MHQFPDEILYDVRLIQRHLEKGLLTREQLAKRLEELADVSSQAELLNLDPNVAADGHEPNLSLNA